MAFHPEAVAVTGQLNATAEAELAALGDLRIYRGENGLLRMLEESEADIVVNGIAGAGGMLPSLRVLQMGTDLALANKETVVMAGPLIKQLLERHGSRLLPVDSEHHALFCLLWGRNPADVREVILTASGGAFRDLSYEQLREVRVEDALTHPNWKMGAKITVDSATMANKGLEVIEARFLFDIPVSAIRVLIHPQSYVHALIRTNDGFLYAQLSQPDMRLPIQSALSFPDQHTSCVEAFDLADKALSFEPIDPTKYRLLALAYQAADGGGAYRIAYNAANEEAVARFLDHEIAFLGIARLVEEVLQLDWSTPVKTSEEILRVDAEARARSSEILKTHKDCLK
jgi:1-deoxy-D-xylulose-5-phosphate reductoisomerase